jgi:regulator of sigma E protease
MSILGAIAGLVFLILIHEAGHFFTALAVRMKPRKFYIFFPPALAKWKRNGIEYGIGAIPLGGYVKIPGMHRPAPEDLRHHLEPARAEAPSIAEAEKPVEAALAEERYDDARVALAELRARVESKELSPRAQKAAERGLTDADDALSGDAYWRAPTSKRVAVIFAGPATNYLFAVIALAIVFMIGIPTGATRVVEEVAADSPAAGMGLQPGDEIVAVDGTRLEWDEVSQAIRSSEGEPVTLTVLRHGQERELQGTPQLDEEANAYRLGFAFQSVSTSYGPLEALGLAFESTWFVTKEIVASLGRLVTGEGRDEVASVVGITAISSESLEEGFSYYLQVLALISLSLALLNLLPFLPLDGGHIAFSIAERIRGRAIPREAYERASIVGIALVLFLFFIGLTNDINRLSGG